MAKQPFISHVVNGYSRYDVPESKAFSCTPGIAYPVRIDFINARDRVTIDQGIDVRSNPLAVPTFNPYTVRLHRFWVPMQLYHPEMRTNSSKFDMNDVSINWIPTSAQVLELGDSYFSTASAFTNSLLSWLRLTNGYAVQAYGGSAPTTAYDGVALPPASDQYYYSGFWANADTYLAYWDIVRNYYSFSQFGLFSFAWPASWAYTAIPSAPMASHYSKVQSFFNQRYGNLQFLDAYFESQFYPNAVQSSNNTYNRSNLFFQLMRSDLDSTATDGGIKGDGYPVATNFATSVNQGSTSPASQFATAPSDGGSPYAAYFTIAHPMAVVPSSPDRFSRLLPTGSDSSVSMTGVSTIPQLAVASRLQEYKDLLGAGGSRFSDWLETFFASKIEHVDRPKLLFSASQTVNAQVVLNQSGFNNFEGTNSSPLGAQGGTIAFNSKLGRSQSYYFREPGYMIDILSIRPVYYWAGIRPDYADYTGADYFNPIYNDIGYQSVNPARFGYRLIDSYTIANEPCFNEFRSSYDEVLGQLSVFQSTNAISGITSIPFYSYWVQQRYLLPEINTDDIQGTYYRNLFVDMSTVNSPFASNTEDNFFVNLSYSVRKKNLVNKTFATRLSNR